MRWGRVFTRILGMLMIFSGTVWFLQGIRILPGSFMTGSRFWAVTGAVVALAGIVLLQSLARRRTV